MDATLDTKSCSKCHAVKAFSEFARNGDKPHSWCKECCSRAAKERYRNNPEHREKRLRYNADRYANDANCRNAVKAAAKRSYERKMADPILRDKERERISTRDKRPEQRAKRKLLMARLWADPEWSSRMRATIKEWQQTEGKSPDRIKRRADYMHDYSARRMAEDPEFRASRYRNNELRRHRKKQLPYTLTPDEWDRILRLQGNQCAKCGSPFGLFVKPTRDHILPQIRGGGLTIENTQALCVICNSGKGTAHIDYRTDRHKRAIGL